MTQLGDFVAARKIGPNELAALAFSRTTVSLFSDGSAEHLITRPADMEGRTLVLQADKGNWRLRPGDYVSRVVVGGSNAVDEIDVAAHLLTVGDGPYRFTEGSGAALPTGVLVDTDYWVAEASSGEDAGAISLATSLANAAAVVPVLVSITVSSGSGTLAMGGSAHGVDAGSGWANVADPAEAQIGVVGYGASKLGQGATVLGSAPQQMTVRAFVSGDVLTYWFV